MKLEDIQTSKGYLDRPNIEFEEKLMSIVAGDLDFFQNTPPNFSPPADFPGFEGVND
ncbi:MAG: hypothetical protein ACLFUB_11055 [Cyclobacteriaceae bacterium]